MELFPPRRKSVTSTQQASLGFGASSPCSQVWKAHFFFVPCFLRCRNRHTDALSPAPQQKPNHETVSTSEEELSPPPFFSFLFCNRGGGDSKVENLSADFHFFCACMLPVGVGKNKNSRGRKKKLPSWSLFRGVSREIFFSTKIPNIIR